MKTSSKKVLGATLVASILAAAAIPAIAQPGEGAGHRGGKFGPIIFSELDSNGDGFLTQEEMDARKAAKFAEIDTNGDGQLSADEIVASHERADDERRARRAGRMIEALDTNDDGLISAEEMAAHEGGKRRGGNLFERADADDDGQISEEEFQTAMSKMQKRFGQGGKKRH
ncbi:EF-hand domain-containing protein [Actibacterium pelagium]|uniref:EF-hand domain-containing protein n=1 Tax=Actibacterium pelagium TaxID=2029103 RepID=A0A917ALJ0_9RHOB|nr:EF-hand domain-containing protein [Actibacterium pelagium]GGE59798.1 hypothetical protein GCM10011517_29220 [Actibacterium pelagium]